MSSGQKGKRWRRLCGIVAVANVIVTSTRPLRAEDLEALIKKGVELRRQGKDREALAEFERALQIERQPRVQAQIGFAEHALGLWSKAETHLSEALEARRDDAWNQKNQPTIEASLRIIRSHVARLEVWGSPEGAEVLLNGELVGRLPLGQPARVTEEQVSIEVRAAGFTGITRVVHVRLGELAREHVDLHAVPAALSEWSLAAPPPGLPSTATPAPERPTSSLSVKTPQTAGPRTERLGTPLYGRWWFWTTVAVVAAGAGAAAFLLTRHRGETCTPPECSIWPN